MDRVKLKYSVEKTCPSSTLCTTNPRWTDPDSNPGLRGGRPVANRLNQDTAYGDITKSPISPNSCHKFEKFLTENSLDSLRTGRRCNSRPVSGYVSEFGRNYEGTQNVNCV
jgi:hypothetical protein